jgi:hypothetical protein
VPVSRIPRRLSLPTIRLVAAGAAAAIITALAVAIPAPTGAVPPHASSLSATASRAAACTTGVWDNLATCGWPSPSSTGPKKSRCGGRMSTLGNGPGSVVRLTTPGQQIRCRTIRGCVEIDAQNVSLTDVKVICTSGRTGEDANGTGVVKILDGASATLRRILLRGLKGNHACVWHQGTAATVIKADCAGVDDGVFSWTSRPGSGDNVRIRNSYFHDFTTRTSNGHVDGYQTTGASHGRIVHNTFLMTSDAGNDANSAIAIWDAMDDSEDFEVAHNLIAGGGFAVYAEDYSPSESSPAGGYSVSNIRFNDNAFSTRLFPCVGFYGVWFPRGGAPADGWHRSGNRVLETGQSVDAGNPTAGGRSCT